MNLLSFSPPEGDGEEQDAAALCGVVSHLLQVVLDCDTCWKRRRMWLRKLVVWA